MDGEVNILDMCFVERRRGRRECAFEGVEWWLACMSRAGLGYTAF